MSPVGGLGHATHPSLQLRDANDALIIFEAVRLGILPLIKRRLTSDERDQLGSGNVFVWEEAEHKGGLERWTDGRRWSQSRMKGDFLFYEEKIETTEEERMAKAARRASRNAGNLVQQAPTRRQDRPAKPDGLTKQTYSTYACLSSSMPPRKWHIVAYFTGSDYSRLPVVENYDYLRRIRVPPGVFLSSKGSTRRSDGDGDDDEGSVGSSSLYDGSDLGRISPFELRAPPGRHDYLSSVNGPKPPHDGRGPRLSKIPPVSPQGRYTPHLPSPISPGGISPAREYFASGPSSPRNYKPLSSEDRRALSTFKLGL